MMMYSAVAYFNGIGANFAGYVENIQPFLLTQFALLALIINKH